MNLFNKRVEAAERVLYPEMTYSLDVCRTVTREALEAADSVVTEEELERVLSGAFQGWTDQDDPFGDQARAVLALFRGGEINV